jgi:2-dehydro-3-deoxyphosphogluconate aldolase/(4S)-4-hydroxy-2-oxoglutarate aldolase
MSDDQRGAVVEALSSATLVGVIRARDEARARAAVEGLLEGGFRALEVTADTPGCASIIAELARRTRAVTLGVGTVTAPETVATARAAGASFVVSPHTDPELVRVASASGLVVIPGAFTPTEILHARRAGADFVKLFPVSAGGGPRFVRALRGPLPEVPLWVSGDVPRDEIGAYLAAGATLIGLTSALTADLEDLDAQAARDVVAERATQCLAAAAAARDEAVLLTLVAGAGRLQVDLRSLRRLPGTEHVSIEALVPNRRGHGVRVRRLLEHLGVERGARLRLRSQDGFEREVAASQLYDGGVIQYALDGRPLDAAEGGPLRLFIVDGSDQCDNVKGLARMELA